MVLRTSLLVLLAFPLLPLASPAAATTLYTWRASDGSIMFTDDPKGAPPDAEVQVWREDAPPPAPEPVSTPTEVAAAPIAPERAAQATQGEFAVRLVEELGLLERADAAEAADLLTQARIAPRLGRWELDQPMTPELTLRLRTLTVAAAAEGRITLTPEESLLAFDTTAALLGVTIPETADSEELPEESPWPMAAAPALVYLIPPPPTLYPYYLWVPVADGFWRHQVFVSGVFVLDADRFFAHRHRHRHHHRIALTPDHTRHRIRRHFELNEAPGVLDNPSPRPRRDVHVSGAQTSGEQPARQFVAPRSPVSSHIVRSRPLVAPRFSTSKATIRQPSPSPGRNAASVTTIGPPRHNRPGVRAMTIRESASENAAFSTDRSSRSRPAKMWKRDSGGREGDHARKLSFR